MKKYIIRTLIVSVLLFAMLLPVVGCADANITASESADVALINANGSASQQNQTTEGTVQSEESPSTFASVAPIDPATFVDPFISYDCDDGSKLYTYVKKTESDFLGVCAYYTSKGYEQYMTADMGGNLSATYVKGSEMAHIYWHPTRQELNLVKSSTAGATLPPANPAVTDGEYVCSVVQLQDTKKNNGMGYIIQLKDGSYIIYDGSYEHQLEKITAYLKSTYKGEGLPTIRAWLITHSHADHIPSFQAFCKANATTPIANVECVIAAGLDDKTFPIESEVNNYLSSESFKNDVALLNGRTGAKIVYAHTGMKFKFCNLNMEILYAPESFFKMTTLNIGNNTASIVSRLYDENYSALFLGDVTFHASDMMEDIYGDYLKSDMCQMSHHGVENVRLSFYELVQAQILFYPCNKALYENDRHKPVRTALEGKSYTKEILIQSLNQYVRNWGTVYAENAPLSKPDFS